MKNKKTDHLPNPTRRTIVKGLAASPLVLALGANKLGAQELSQMSSNSQSSNSDFVNGVSDSQVVLGTSAAFTGPSRGLGIELYRGAMAYFHDVNSKGGVHGREITLKLYDDGYQPDPAVNNTTKLMRDDKVFALFGYVGTPTVTRVLPLLKRFQDENFLLFFPFTGAQPQRQLPYGPFAFNLRASYRQETAGLVENFISVGRQKIGVFYQADAYGRSGWAGCREALAKHNLKMIGEATYTRGTQYTASLKDQVEWFMRDKPDAIVCIGAYAACAAFLRDAVDGGLQIPIANLSFVGSENLLKLITDTHDNPKQYSQFLVNSQVVPSYNDLSLNGVQMYDEFMTKNAPDVPEQFASAEEEYKTFDRSFVSLEGFLNAKLMTEILTRIGQEPTREGIEEAVFSIQDLDLGIGETVSFNEDRRQGLDRVYYTIVEDGSFVPLKDWTAASNGWTEATSS